MSIQPKPMKLSRKQIKDGLEQMPVEHLFSKSVSRELTHKQKSFALEIAKGSTGAAAYRKHYDSQSSKKTHGDAASRLKADIRIKSEIAAYALAIEAEKHRTPAALRALVIQSLVQVVIDPDAKQATKVAAAKVLGTVTEVAAFTERKEVRTITSSEDARARVMGELRRLMNAGATDATIVDADALLAELAGNASVAGQPGNESQGLSQADEGHPSPMPPET